MHMVLSTTATCNRSAGTRKEAKKKNNAELFICASYLGQFYSKMFDESFNRTKAFIRGTWCATTCKYNTKYIRLAVAAQQPIMPFFPCLFH